ncbi:MAG: 4a-hydroxytetrahydrobiopterin dehydratase [Candidatus Tectomicrobia bacterium]|nr:4a-hydroxytetrahydrobiopterin dehydratase [Candidatus Tectomicrobia bacterium]
MARLTEEEIGRGLEELPGWERQGEAIVKTFQFEWFTPAMGFVTKVALLAERYDHHPDIDIRYKRVRLVLTSHDAGGLTERDVNLAKEIEAVR